MSHGKSGKKRAPRKRVSARKAKSPAKIAEPPAPGALPLHPVEHDSMDRVHAFADTIAMNIKIPAGTIERTLEEVTPTDDASRELKKHAFIMKYVVEYRCSRCGMIFKVPLHKKLTGSTYGPPPDVRGDFEKHVCQDAPGPNET